MHGQQNYKYTEMHGQQNVKKKVMYLHQLAKYFGSSEPQSATFITKP